MNYEQAMEYIHAVQWAGHKPGLTRTRTLLAALGDPHKKLQFVHVAGTNGKGSTAAMLEGKATIPQVQAKLPLIREVQTDGIEKVIAERLQELVKIHGIGIPELAERCGLKRQRAKKLMNGEVKMSIAEAVSIVNEFQVSLEYLLGRYPYPLPAPQTEEEWMVYEKLGQMDENEAQKYLEIMMPMQKGLT